MKWHWVKWGLLAAAVFSENAVAQGGLSDDELFDMEFEDLLKVKIRVSTKSEVEQSRAPSIISTFTRQQIDAFNAVSLIDIIKHAPSIEASMGANGNWRVSIRGERKPGNILMLLNGQPINNLYDGHALFDLPASIIEQVEIIRGPGSALYGTNAVAGVINVVTQSDAKRAAAHLANYGGYGVSGQYSGQKESTSWSILFGLDTHDSEDLVDYYPEKVTNLIVSDTTNRHFEQQYFDISYTFSAFNAELFYMNRDNGAWIGPVFDFGPQTEVQQTHWHVKGRYDWALSSTLKITPMISTMSQSLDALNQDITAGTTLLNNTFEQGGFTKENYSVDSHEGVIEIDYSPSQSLKSLSGISIQHQKIGEYDLTRNYQVIGFIPQDSFANHDNLGLEQRHRSRKVTALYTQLEYSLDDLAITLGGRYDDYSDFGDSFNPRLGAVYNFSQQWKFKALYGSAFRAPTMLELYDNTRIGADGIIGNQQLRPEESDTLEAGIEFNRDGLIVRADVFKRASDNVIEEFDRQGTGARGSIQNIGSIDTTGGALEVIYQLSSNLRAEMNASRYRAEFRYKDSELFEREIQHLQTDGQKELFNQPRTRLNAALWWRENDWRAFISANYGGRLSHNNTTQLEGLRKLQVNEYLQWNLGFTYQWNQRLSVGLSAFNLFDKKHSDPTGGSNSDALGNDGMIQPYKNISVSFSYEL